MPKSYGLSTCRPPAEEFARTSPRRVLHNYLQKLVSTQVNDSNVHHFYEYPTCKSQQTLPNVTHASGREFPFHMLHDRHPSASCSLVHESTPLDVAPCATFAATPRHSLGGRGVLGAWPHSLAAQSLFRPPAGGIFPTSHPSRQNGGLPVELSERKWPVGGLCGTLVGGAGGMVTPDPMYTSRSQVDVDEKWQEGVLGSTHGPGASCRPNRLLNHNRQPEKNKGSLSPGILRDAHLLLSIIPNVLDEEVHYNKNWTLWDMITFNGILIDESEITCQWVGLKTICNERMQVKDIKIHLAHKHGVVSDSLLYQCCWRECSVSKPMRRSSLARHVREGHSSVKWACPSCEETFTRHTTLLRHFKSCPGRSEP